jgi:hypothetical protein
MRKVRRDGMPRRVPCRITIAGDLDHHCRMQIFHNKETPELEHVNYLETDTGALLLANDRS